MRYAKTTAVLGSIAGLIALAVGYWPPAEPEFFSGVPADHVAVAAAIQANYPPSFQDASGLTEEQSAANIPKNVRLWGSGLKLNPGPQAIGDCVSWGAATSLQVCIWKSSGGRESPEVSTLFLYGLARKTVGRGKPPCNRDGAYPTYAVQGIEQRGFLFSHEAGLPAYSGAAAKRFGCDGPTSEQLQAARVRSGGTAQPITDIKAWRNAICFGYPLTVAIPWQPGRVYVADGRRCMAFDGSNRGGHQICSIGYDGSSGKPYWFLFNSHGPGFAGGTLQGEPAGGVWVDEKWARWIVDNGELWAISDIPGFEADELDLKILDRLNAATPPRVRIKERNDVKTVSAL